MVVQDLLDVFLHCGDNLLDRRSAAEAMTGKGVNSCFLHEQECATNQYRRSMYSV